MEDFSNGSHAFATSIYQELAKTEKDNLLVSPFSLQIILALTQSGAKGKTGEEIRTALHFTKGDGKIRAVFHKLVPTLSKFKVTLQTATKVYIDKRFELHEAFKKVAANIYFSEIENMDVYEATSTASEINRWVAERTGNKIQNIVNEDNINHAADAILINTMYLKGQWKSHFPVASTEKRDFYKTAKEVIKVDTMNGRQNVGYQENGDLKAKYLELPLEDQDLSVVFVLPDDKEGLKTFESQSKIFNTKKFSNEEVLISLPKFKIESKFKLKEILNTLGIKILFTKEADLTGMVNNPGLLVNEVLQKTFMVVSEGGVETAAVTTTDPGGSGGGKEKKYREFKADHPFLFYIKAKDIILFVGKVTDPTK